MIRPLSLAVCAGCILIFAWTAGCGQVPAPAKKTSKSTKKPATVARAPASPPTVAADAYPSVAAAMAEVEEIGKSNTGDNGPKLFKIETWLRMQGDKIAPELAASIKDPSQGLATRLTACRVLARIGPVATPTLIAAADGEPKQLRLKAIESLGRIDPPSREILDKLMALIETQDYEVRKVALGAVANLGPPAKSAVPKLVAILNDVNEDETIRSLAKAALKKVDPRKGLMGMEK